MHVTFRQLRLFLALAETGSVSAAARATHVTQPTASMQLREVSESLGIPLYEVIAKKVHLTDAGRELAQTGRAIANEWDVLEQKINATKGLTRGKLRVAVVARPSTSCHVCLDLFASATQRSTFHWKYSIVTAS